MPASDSPVPVEVRALAQRRAAARAERDFAAADSLRQAISAAGWLVRDTPTGFELVPKPPYDLLGSLSELYAAADTGGRGRLVGRQRDCSSRAGRTTYAAALTA
jgi:hypothetical protein